jgi:hypothetical protein
MSWRCTGKSNAELIANLKRHGLIKTESVRKAMELIDRADYCPFEAYVDGPQVGFSIHSRLLFGDCVESVLKEGCAESVLIAVG